MHLCCYIEIREGLHALFFPFDKLSISKLGHVSILVTICFEQTEWQPPPHPHHHPNICIRTDQLDLVVPPGEVAESRCEWLLEVKKRQKKNTSAGSEKAKPPVQHCSKRIKRTFLNKTQSQRFWFQVKNKASRFCRTAAKCLPRKEKKTRDLIRSFLFKFYNYLAKANIFNHCHFSITGYQPKEIQSDSCFVLCKIHFTVYPEQLWVDVIAACEIWGPKWRNIHFN